MSGVTVISSNGYLQLRWTAGGKRQYLSLGLPDSPCNRAIADLRKQQLEIDTKLGIADPTFQRYKPNVINLPLALPKDPKLKEVWAKFYDYRSGIVKSSTFCYYKTIGNHLKRYGADKPLESKSFFLWLTKSDNLSQGTAARVLEATKAAYKWGVMAGLVCHNPIAHLAISKPRQRNISDPFTKPETLSIIARTSDTPYHGFIQFLFSTGCRTGEALAVQWGDISDSQIRFSRNLAKGVYLTTPKTGIRYFPINDNLKNLLEVRGSNNDRIHDFKLRSFQNFWTHTIEELVKNTLVARYRPQYQTRHTFVTRCAESNIPPAVVAKWIGDRPSTVVNHYQGATGDYIPP